MTTVERLRLAVDEVADLYATKDVDWSRPVYPLWDAREVLAHLVAWHESFSAIADARVHGRVPPVPQGTLAAVNQQGVDALADVSVRTLRRRLLAAQCVIEDAAAHLSPDEPLPYRRGSRLYTFSERLAVSVGELDAHRRDVVRAYVA